MRRLVVVADDFGIGPETSRGILELAQRHRITATVLLVTSPHAEQAVRAWRQAGTTLALGWHPCLTLDRPVLPARAVPSLVGRDGAFHKLPRFLLHLLRGRIDHGEVAAELRAQYQRFTALVGAPPPCVNFHHHLHCLAPIRRALASILTAQQPRPYLRRVREHWRSGLTVPGARLKRVGLSLLGRWTDSADFPGNDWLAQADAALLSLRCAPGQVVELVCHPGFTDPTLAGRDARVAQRLREWQLLASDQFTEAVERAGIVLTAPTDLLAGGIADAA